MAILLSPLDRPDVRRVHQAGEATELLLETRDSFSVWGDLAPVPYLALKPDVRRLLRLAVSNARRVVVSDPAHEARPGGYERREVRPLERDEDAKKLTLGWALALIEAGGPIPTRSGEEQDERRLMLHEALSNLEGGGEDAITTVALLPEEELDDEAAASDTDDDTETEVELWPIVVLQELELADEFDVSAYLARTLGAAVLVEGASAA